MYRSSLLCNEFFAWWTFMTYSGLKSKHFFGIASHSKISYFEIGAAGEQCPYKELAGCALVAGGTSALVGGGEGFPNGLAPTIPTMTHTCSHQQWIFGSRLAHYIPTPIFCSSSWKVDSWTLFLELSGLSQSDLILTIENCEKWEQVNHESSLMTIVKMPRVVVSHEAEVGLLFWIISLWWFEGNLCDEWIQARNLIFCGRKYSSSEASWSFGRL